MKRTRPGAKTPKGAVLRYCRECVGHRVMDIEACQGDQLLSGGSCPFFKYRLGEGRPSVREIKKECLRCMGNSKLLVKECETITCPLHPYRFGTNPARRRTGRFSTEIIC